MKFNIKNDCRGMDTDEIISAILDSRGIEDTDSFFNPCELDMLPLDSMGNINKAYKKLQYHVNNHNKIIVNFDSDLDGLSSGTIITRYLNNFTQVSTTINKGKSHGMLGRDLSEFYNFDLLIIVDSLDSNINAYKKLSEHGVDLIILDHHIVNPKIPYEDYAILVTSNINYANPQLSGSGVVWKFCKYCDEQNGTEYADKLIDLGGVGIIGDMMDMRVLENRYIVSEALNNLNNPAIKKIVGSFDFNSTGISFSIAPLANASCRLNCNESALRAFLADDNKEVLKYVKVLKKCKEDQNAEVDNLMPDVLAQCDNQIDKKMIVVYIDTEYGISGLLGNKLLERYKRPILILKDCGKTFSGSMRAVGMDDFAKICNESGLAECNGHELAAGITIMKDNMESFIAYIEDYLQHMEVTEQTIEVDAEISMADITRNLVDKVKQIDKVSGSGFKPLKFLVRDITNFEVGNMSQGKHLVLKYDSGLQFIKWNYTGSFEDYEDASLMDDNVIACVTLDSGFFGRNFVLKAICDYLEID